MCRIGACMYDRYEFYCAESCRCGTHPIYRRPRFSVETVAAARARQRSSRSGQWGKDRDLDSGLYIICDVWLFACAGDSRVGVCTLACMHVCWNVCIYMYARLGSSAGLGSGARRGRIGTGTGDEVRCCIGSCRLKETTQRNNWSLATCLQKSGKLRQDDNDKNDNCSKRLDDEHSEARVQQEKEGLAVVVVMLVDHHNATRLPGGEVDIENVSARSRKPQQKDVWLVIVP